MQYMQNQGGATEGAGGHFSLIMEGQFPGKDKGQGNGSVVTLYK